MTSWKCPSQCPMDLPLKTLSVPSTCGWQGSQGKGREDERGIWQLRKDKMSRLQRYQRMPKHVAHSIQCFWTPFLNPLVLCAGDQRVGGGSGEQRRLTFLSPQGQLKPVSERSVGLPRCTLALQELSHLVKAIPSSFPPCQSPEFIFFD